MNILFTADLHFTDNPRDDYRWDLLPWLAKMCRQHKVDLVVIGGDITDAKDKHPSALVNKLVRGLSEIAEHAPVVILKGNHDYIDEGEPFFGFTNKVASGYDIKFLVDPGVVSTKTYKPLGPAGNLLFLPNAKDYRTEWDELEEVGWDKYELIFTHATFDGCESESGFKLSGIPPSYFKGAKKVWSGDIHKPQMVGRNIEYVGAPYRIRFGDAFVPRVVLLDRTPSGIWRSLDLRYKCQGKHIVEIDNPASPKAAINKLANTTETGGLEIYEGDQVKVRVRLPRSAYPDWPAIKEALIAEAVTQNLQLTGPELVAIDEPRQKQASRQAAQPQDAGSPLEALAAYAEEKDVPDELRNAGERYLKQAMG